ncbi:MAG: Ig-like domain-containing protein, partial [Bacteroidales bacterium]|nr:Ig-like domain-containing protein [Bacteroidales bacterium]
LFSSANEAIATVDSTGKVVGVAAGTVTITVTAHDASGVDETIDIKVFEAPVGSIVLSTDAQGDSIAIGSSLMVSAVYTPASGSDDSVLFVSRNDAIATIDADGKVMGVAAGSVYVIATAHDGSGVKDSIQVKVYSVPVTSIALSAPAASGDSVEIGSTLQLTAAVLPANATDDSVVYSTGDASIATVSDAGLVTGVAAGTVTITATAHDGSTITGTIDIKVYEAVSLNEYSIASFTIIPNPSNGQIQVVLPGNSVENASYMIYSISGNKVAEGLVSNNGTLVLDELSTGVYYMMIEDNRTVYREKLIIE